MSFAEVEENVRIGVEWRRLPIECLGALTNAAGVVVAGGGPARPASTKGGR